jgi:hypothetical protein
LTKVLVESERLRNLQLIHDNFAGTVGEAPTLVFVLSKCGPCLPNIFFGQEVDLGDRAFEELLTEQLCPLAFATCAQQCECFVNYVVGGY